MIKYEETRIFHYLNIKLYMNCSVFTQILGIDSEFCIVESFITGMVDYWPDLLRPHRIKFTIVICLLMFALGIPMVTNVSIQKRASIRDVNERHSLLIKILLFQGGIYIFQLMDFYSASGMSILWVCFFQTIAISWIFGAKKFCDCVHQMMGIRLNKFWYICWVLLAPVIMLVSIMSHLYLICKSRLRSSTRIDRAITNSWKSFRETCKIIHYVQRK